MTQTVKVAQTSDLAPGQGKTVDVEGQRIALFNVDGTFFAIDDTCTHEGGPLGEGELNADIVTCPWHAAEFNVKTGDVTDLPADEGVRRLPVKVEGDDVLVELD